MMVADQQFKPGFSNDSADETADQADTHITINPPAAPAPRPATSPELPPISMIPASAVKPTPEISPEFNDEPRMGAQTIAAADGAASSDTVAPAAPQSHINWGGIIKGAVIVGAVVLAGVGGFMALHAIGAWALGNATVGTLMTPVVHGVSYAAGWLQGFVPAGIFQPIGAFFTHMLGTTALTHAQIVTAAGTSHVLTHGLALAGAGGAAALGVTIAAPTLHDIHMHTTDPTAHQPDASNDGNLFSNLVASKSATVNAHLLAGDNSHSVLADHADHAAMEHASEHASEHALEDRGHRKHTSWADRATGSSGFRSALQSNGGSYSAAIRDTQKSNEIAPRGASYVKDLDKQTAALNAALEPTR